LRYEAAKCVGKRLTAGSSRCSWPDDGVARSPYHDARIRSWHRLAQAVVVELKHSAAIRRANTTGTAHAVSTPMEKRVDLLCAVAAVLALVGCSGPSSNGAPSTPAQLAQASEARVPASSISQDSLGAAVAANNAFAVDLYSRLAHDSDASNVLTSPISASLALTMTYAGAQGQTATEMATALHLDAVAGTAVFDGQNALSQALASRGQAALMLAQQNAQQSGQSAPSASDYELQVVNSVWGEKNYLWADPFLTILAQSYGAGVYLQDFINQSDQARQTINAWVSNQTNDKINNLLPSGSLDDTTRMVLVNAIHLKFPWLNTFDPSATAASTFTRADGTTVSPSFMNQTTTLPYVDDGQAQIVGLPLSGQVSVVVALPHQGVDLASYEAGLSATSAALSQPRASALVALSVPKVTFTSPTFSLMTSLKAMGMIQAFDMMSANFHGMCPNPPDGNLYVSDVLQKATVAMQETGVEAAAATAVIIDRATSGESSPPTPVPMIVDRPYLIAIVDVPTGAVLFLGHIEDPTDSGSP
jgi:serpin B